MHLFLVFHCVRLFVHHCVGRSCRLGRHCCCVARRRLHSRLRHCTHRVRHLRIRRRAQRANSDDSEDDVFRIHKMLPEPAFVFFATAKRARDVQLGIMPQEKVEFPWPIHPDVNSGLSALQGQVCPLSGHAPLQIFNLKKTVPDSSLTDTECVQLLWMAVSRSEADWQLLGSDCVGLIGSKWGGSRLAALRKRISVAASSSGGLSPSSTRRVCAASPCALAQSAKKFSSSSTPFGSITNNCLSPIAATSFG